MSTGKQISTTIDDVTVPDSSKRKPFKHFIPQSDEVISLEVSEMSAVPFTITQTPSIPDSLFFPPNKIDHIETEAGLEKHCKPCNTNHDSVVNCTHDIRKYEIIFILAILFFIMFIFIPSIIVTVIHL